LGKKEVVLMPVKWQQAAGVLDLKGGKTTFVSA